MQTRRGWPGLRAMPEWRGNRNGRDGVSLRDRRFQISNLRFQISDFKGLRLRTGFAKEGMIGREMLAEKFLEVGDAGFASLAFFVIGAGVIVEVTLTGNVGIL